jgi:hypothetical protein
MWNFLKNAAEIVYYIKTPIKFMHDLLYVQFIKIGQEFLFINSHHFAQNNENLPFTKIDNCVSSVNDPAGLTLTFRLLRTFILHSSTTRLSPS